MVRLDVLVRQVLADAREKMDKRKAGGVVEAPPEVAAHEKRENVRGEKYENIATYRRGKHSRQPEVSPDGLSLTE